MKTLRIFALLLILTLSFALLTSCEILDGIMSNTPECEHEWVDGKCSICSTVCDHDFDPEDNYACIFCGVQAIVPPEEKYHDWHGGVCTVCGRECEHSFDENDECSVCGVKLTTPPMEECKHEWNDGECTLCGVACEHDFDENEKCTVCGVKLHTPPMEECKHEWSQGVCTLCGTVCEHSFDPGNDYTCTICGVQAPVPPECKHEWTDGVCSACGTVCEHVFSGDTCEVCGIVKLPEPPQDDCTHAWIDGVCTLCGKECEHDFGFGTTCSICGEWLSGSYILLTYNKGEYKVRYESTLAEFISEHLGTTYEATVANGSYWMALDPFNLDKINLEADTPLNQFGACFELYLISGSVTPPTDDCIHEWIDGVCSACGTVCEHSFDPGNDYTCTVCGVQAPVPPECKHYWQGGVCSYCGLSCEHPELSTYGYCSVCGYECQHHWNIDYCEHCGFHCDHTFDGPTCTKCGYTSGGIDNPLTIKFEDTEYVTPYSATFQELFYLYSDLAHRLGYNDYQESMQYGYWVVVTDSGDVRIGEYTSLCEFGHVMTIAYRKDFIEECHHLYWSDGHCTSCGIACQHGAFLDGMCGICGMSCEHSWNNGQCMICFKECEHSFYDGICNVCGFHKEGSDDERVTISLSIQDGIGSDSFSDYTVSVPYSIALYNFFDADLRTEDGATMFIPYETNFLVRVNGKVIDFEEFHYIYITGGEQIVIYRCYSFELETVVNGESSYIIYNTPTSVSGAELMYAAGIDPNTNCTIWINGAMFESYTSFADTIFPLFDEYCCFIRFECLDAHAGTVRLEIYEEGYSSGYYEEIGELNVSNYISYGDDFGDFLWTLEYPNGEMVDLETLEMTIFFDPSYTDGENGATVYKLYRKWNVFFVNLQIDDQPYEPLKFYKSDGLTVRDILSAFGFYSDYDNYNWTFNSYGGEHIDSLDSIVYYDLSIDAYDSRPYVEIKVDGVSYKAHHTTTLTLADAISLINETHGTSITFEGYIWYAYSNESYRTERVYDPYSFILVEPGYSRDATAKTLTEVEVYFATDFGPINDELGMESITFKKGDAWWTPEIAPRILEETGGFVTFNGGFEYRVEEKWEIVERYDVNSIEELFALNLETVTLCAKYEVNYEKLCGTYAKHDEILVITESTVSIFYRHNGYFSEAKPYKVGVSGNQICLNAEDNSFCYYTSMLNEYVKIEDGGFCAVVRMPDGWIDMYTSYDEYLYVTEWSNIDYVTDKDGGYIGEVSKSGLYFVYASEKPYIEEY